MRTLLTFIPHISYGVVKDIVAEHNSKLDRVRKVLAEKGEGLTEAIEYQKKGAAWKRKKVLEDCESWMNATNCPNYLREEYRQKAYASCDNDYIARVASALSSLRLDLAKDVEVTADGEWRVVQAIPDNLLEARRYTLTEEEAEAFRLYQELLSIAEKLRERNYFITSSFAGEDCLYHQDSEEEDMEYFLNCYREPK